ncbi:uncharacterized protein L201_006825 [Kwoniella dendrophila CBS 6074]|uniref:ferric-chelate reductase (NADPH) n=1 Tax=Kwoniella dendrophila CBS 6074 TaxID=1295534 RepID=A0AAX4K287_9TREE
MTVTGPTTAQQAPSNAYTPPFKYVTSYVQSPEVTGSITRRMADITLKVNPTVTASSDNAYATAYLQAHQMSWPSYRYAYLLWFVFIALAGIYALAHHLRLSGGTIGAGFKKWAMKRKPLGRKKKAGGSRGIALPSNGSMISIGIIVAISCVLALIGSDYINPNSSTFNFSDSFNSKKKRAIIGYTINKSFWTLGSRFGFISFALIPLVVLLALKSPPIAIFSWKFFTNLYSDKLALFHKSTAWLVYIFTTVHVVLWTIQLFRDHQNGKAVWFLIWNSYRFIFGCVAYGAMTAVMVLSLKPIRKNSYEFFYWAHVVTVLLTIVCSAIHHPILWFWMAGALALWGLERGFRFMRLAKINGMFGKKKRNNYDSLAGKPYQDTTQSYGMQELKRGNEYDPPYTDKTLPRPPPTQRDSEYESNDFGKAPNQGYYDEGSLQPLGSYESRYDQPPPHQRTDSSASMMPIPRNGPAANISLPRSASAASMGGPSSDPRLSLVPVAIPIGYAQAQLLPSRTVRLTINVSRPFKWSPGQSVLLYLPELSRLQSHPFTITNNDPHEIVLLVKARKGLTRQLFDLVRAKSLASVGINDARDKRVSLQSMRTTEKPGLQVPPIFIKAWVDGPMGSSGRVKWTNYSTVLLICGGSGISFGAAICDYVCKKMSQGIGKTQRVRLCWVVREFAEIAWIASQLRRCQNLIPKERFEISIFVTKSHKTGFKSKFNGGGDELALPRPGFVGGPNNNNQRRGSTDSITSQMSVDSDLDNSLEYYDGQTTTDGHFISNASTSNYTDIIDLTNYEDEEDVNDPIENNLSENLQKQGKINRAKSRKAAKKLNNQKRLSTGMSNLPGSPLYPPNRQQQGHQHQSSQSSSLAYEQPQPLQNSAYGGYDEYQQRYSTSSYDDLQPPRAISGYEGGPGGNPYQQQNPYQSQPQHPQSAPMMASNTTASGSDSNQNRYLSDYDRRQSFRSLADSTYNQYNPFNGPGGNNYSMGGGIGPSPSPSIMNFDYDNQSIAGDSVRDILSRTSRTQSMVLLGNDPDELEGESNYINDYDYEQRRDGPQNRSNDRTGGGEYNDNYNSGPDQQQYGGPIHTSGLQSGGKGGKRKSNLDRAKINKDGGLWIDESDYAALEILTDLATVKGKPKLESMIKEEIDLKLGNMMVATCGPIALNTVIRNLVSKHISPSKLRRGDKSGQIDFYSEDYES